MRYRPLAHLSMAISTVSLRLDDRVPRSVAEWAALSLAALDCGINGFEISGRSPALIDGVAQALRTVERRLIHLTWRFGPTTMPTAHAANAFSAAGMLGLARAVTTRTGLGYLDLAVLDDPGRQDLSSEGLHALRQMKSGGLLRALGVTGRGDEIDVYIATGAFDVLATPFNMLSGWRDRNRLKAAGDRNMSVFGYDPYPKALAALSEAAAKSSKSLLGWGKKHDRLTSDPYGFLHGTPDWSAENICLAYAMTEPGLASVQVEPRSVPHLQALAAVAERELPAGLPAQIEMSRFAGSDKDERRA
jgi:aryl-alcohol dehydrogenase-like predicted oxidoreductase